MLKMSSTHENIEIDTDIPPEYINVLNDIKPKETKNCCACTWSWETFKSFLSKGWEATSLFIAIGSSLSPVFLGLRLVELIFPGNAFMKWFLITCSLLVNTPLNWNSMSQIPDTISELGRFIRKLIYQEKIDNDYKIDPKKAIGVASIIALIFFGTFFANAKMVTDSTPSNYGPALYTFLWILQMLGLTAQAARALISQTFAYLWPEMNAAAKLQKEIILKALYEQYQKQPIHTVELNEKDLEHLIKGELYRSNTFLKYLGKVVPIIPSAMAVLYGVPFGVAAYSATSPLLSYGAISLGFSAAISKSLLLLKSISGLSTDFIQTLDDIFFKTKIIPSANEFSLGASGALSTLLFAGIVAHTGYGAAGVTHKYLFQPIFDLFQGDPKYSIAASLIVGGIASLPINFRDTYQQLKQIIQYTTNFLSPCFGKQAEINKELTDEKKEKIILELMRHFATLSPKSSDSKYIQKGEELESYETEIDAKLYQILGGMSSKKYQDTQKFVEDDKCINYYHQYELDEKTNEITIDIPPDENTSLINKKNHSETYYSYIMKKIGFLPDTKNNTSEDTSITQISKWDCVIS